MVAGARFALEKKNFARVIDFKFTRRQIEVTEYLWTSPFLTSLAA